MKNHTRTRPASALRVLAASATAIAVAGVCAVPAHAAGPAPAALPTVVVDEEIHIADPEASDPTRSLFSYLRDIRGEGTLFGHQHTTSYGVTVQGADGTTSDVNNGVGDFPAMFGWDTLVIEGNERPGLAANTRAQNVALLADYMEKAHAIGGVNTLSVHMQNFVTGGSFYDTTGDTLRAVLPGGDKHDELRAYLDDIALLADSVQDAEGADIPIIFRPWHENAGSWFWWGAAYGSPGEYKELFRFTVEYLRDVKGVDNFLYAFSPGGGFGGNADTYLRTYPGDEFVDVLGYDSYDDGNAGPAWLNGIVTDLGMIADLADAKGKISAFTEFGVGTGALKDNGENPNLTWFTDVLDAIKADPRASRSAYMETWANFGPEQYFVPYPADGDIEEHELLPDFQDFAADPFTYFAGDVTGAFDRTGITTTPHDPLVHLVTPPDGARVASTPTTVRAKVAGTTPDRVFLTVADDPAEIELTLDDDGFWWSGEWAVPADQLDNSTVEVAVHVVVGGVETLSDDASVVLGPRPVFGPGVVDDFEGYGDDTALRSEYVQYNTNVLELETEAAPEGDKALRVTYDFAAQTYTGVGKQISGDWSDFGALSLWVDPDASGNKLVLQLQAGGVSFEAYPSLEGDDPYELTIPWSEWAPAPWDTANAGRRITAGDLADLAQFNVYVNSVEGAAATAGSIVVDDIRATGEAPQLSDVPTTHTLYDEIMWMLENGITGGYGDGTFRGTRPVSRYHMAAFLYRYVDPGYTHAGAPSFSDVPADHAFLDEIEWMVAAGITGGYGDGTYRGAVSVTRGQMVAFMHRMYGSPEPEGAAPFSDVASTHPFHDAIAWASENGVVGGYGDGTFRAGAPVSRQHMAAFLWRYDQVPPPVEESVPLYTFDDGAQGWAQDGGAAPVTGVDGALAITSPAGGGWFGRDGTLGDLSARSEIRMDLVETTGTDPKLVLKLGSGWLWCETALVGWQNGPGTVSFDLGTMSEECQGLLGDTRALFVYLNEGEHVVDDVTAY